MVSWRSSLQMNPSRSPNLELQETGVEGCEGPKRATGPHAGRSQSITGSGQSLTAR
jgi:hypothetical protein